MDEELKKKAIEKAQEKYGFTCGEFISGADFGYHLRDQEVERLRKHLDLKHTTNAELMLKIEALENEDIALFDGIDSFLRYLEGEITCDDKILGLPDAEKEITRWLRKCYADFRLKEKQVGKP